MPISMMSPMSEGIEKLLRNQQAHKRPAQDSGSAPGWWPGAEVLEQQHQHDVVHSSP